MLREARKAILRRSETGAFPELIPLVEQARILRVGGKRLFVHAVGGLRIAEHIELGDAQVSPRNGEGAIQFDGSAPAANRLIVAPLVVIEIAEIVVRPGCRGIARDGALEHDHLLDAGWKAVVAAMRLPPWRGVQQRVPVCSEPQRARRACTTAWGDPTFHAAGTTRAVRRRRPAIRSRPGRRLHRAAFANRLPGRRTEL